MKESIVFIVSTSIKVVTIAVIFLGISIIVSGFPEIVHSQNDESQVRPGFNFSNPQFKPDDFNPEDIEIRPVELVNLRITQTHVHRDGLIREADSGRIALFSPPVTDKRYYIVQALGPTNGGNSFFCHTKSCITTGMEFDKSAMQIRNSETGEILHEFRSFGREDGTWLAILPEPPVMSSNNQFLLIQAQLRGMFVQHFKGTSLNYAVLFDMKTSEPLAILPLNDCIGLTTRVDNGDTLSPTVTIFSPNSKMLLVRQSPYQLDLYELETGRFVNSINLVPLLDSINYGAGKIEWNEDSILRIHLIKMHIPSLSKNSNVSEKDRKSIDWNIANGEIARENKSSANTTP